MNPRPADPIIHDIAGAAAFCKVTEDDIRRWIAEGLKATPVTSGKRGPVRYIFLQSWLLAFIDARAVVRVPKGAESVKPRWTQAATDSDPLAVRPKPKPSA